MPGALTGPSIHAPYHVEGCDAFDIMLVHRFLYDARNGHKAELSVEKIFDRDFVGGVQDNGQRAAGPKRAIRQIETREPVACRNVKFEPPGTGQIERRNAASQRSGYEQAYWI